MPGDPDKTATVRPGAGGAVTIGILGCGRMGTALARAVHALGEHVLLGGRTAPRVPSSNPDGEAIGCDVDMVVRRADVVVLAVPFDAGLDLIEAGRLVAGRGRVLIDASNPRLGSARPLPTGVSGGQILAACLPQWHVVKALNTVPAIMLGQPVLDQRPVSVPVAGDHPAAKATAFTLIRRLGFAPVDAGGIVHAGELEALADLLAAISSRHRLAGRVGFQLAVAEPAPSVLSPVP